MKSKNKILTAFAFICIIIGIVEIILGMLTVVTDMNNNIAMEYAKTIETTEDSAIALIVMKIVIAVIYGIEGLFFIIEGLLIYRASLNGKKTTILIIFLLIGIISQLFTLINAAMRSSYDINSATDVISVIIKAFILKQVFEVRRLDMD